MENEKSFSFFPRYPENGKKKPRKICLQSVNHKFSIEPSHKLSAKKFIGWLNINS